MKQWTTVFLSVSMSLVLGAFLLACSSQFQDYCEDKMDCLDGNDEDVEACVIGFDANKKAAGAYGCSDEFNDLIDCALDESTCEETSDGEGYYTTYDVEAGEDQCSDEGNDWEECLDDNSDLSD